MTREEALKTLEGLQDQYTIAGEVVTDKILNAIFKNYSKAMSIAIAAFRGPTREQVEKAWRGEWERITDPYGKVEDFLCKCGTQTYSASNFCPRCGAPMTDEAVDIVMERLEALKDEID